MKGLLFLLFALVGLSFTQAQRVESFDNEPWNDGSWRGDTALFAAVDGELQLRDTLAPPQGRATIYTPAPVFFADTVTWSLYIRQDFAPSTSNFAVVYLCADQAPLDSLAWRGYFLRIGGSNGATDALELYRKDEQGTVLLLRGQVGAVSGDPAVVRVLVRRRPDGHWVLLADYNGRTDWAVEGSVLDTTYHQGLYFGLQCRYTTTRNRHFFFDDLFINPVQLDTTPPTLLTIRTLSAEQLELTFDEPPAKVDAKHFRLEPDIGPPLSADVHPQDAKRVLLTLAQPLVDFTTYTLHVDSLSDLSGNLLTTQGRDFTYIDIRSPQVGDLLITEIMSDPSPPLGLPEAEYVELYNRTSKAISLAEVAISSGGSPRGLPEYLLLPGQYVTVTAGAARAAFEQYGAVIGLEVFSALANEGDEIRLVNASGQTLAQLNYTLDWYQDDAYSNGGYALELIDLDGPVDCAGNWRASPHPSGGTPGRANDAAGLVVDSLGPRLLNAYTLSSTEIVLVFDEVVMGTEDLSIYTFTPDVDLAEAIPEADGRGLRLLLTTPLVAGQIYTLTLNAQPRDCLGQTAVEGQTFRLGLAETAATGDIIVNELLTNPAIGGADFVELYNRSDRVIDLFDLRLVNTATQDRTNLPYHWQLLPGDYVVLTPDRGFLLDYYTVPSPGKVLPVALPGLAADEGNLTIYSKEFTLLDSFDYRASLHDPLLAGRRGVSLERLHPDAPTQSASSWYSAAAGIGHATPTYLNSQFRETMPSASDARKIFALPETTFSPDGDGYQDLLLFTYQTDQPGYTANVRVFDAQGRQVRHWLRQELLAGEGFYHWDGRNDAGQLQRMGIYILQIELFTPGGEVRRERHVCVLARRL